MQKQIEINNKKIDYTLRTSKRAKRLRLAVYGDGSLVVTKPFGLNENKVEQFIIQKSNWVLSKIEFFKQFKHQKFKDSPESYLANKEKSLAFINSRVELLNEVYGFSYNKITVRNQKTRWGSCSKQGNLNFNYKILFLSGKVADYIIAHELCHLGEFNHSQKFWQLVAKAIPDYSEIKKDLRSKGINYF